MAKLYIITGPAGVGKSTVSRKIALSIKKSVLIEGDNIYHQVVGGYVKAWKEGNHLDIFWEVCINMIRTYLENGYDVIFDYIVYPEPLKQISDSFKDYPIKFVVLLADEQSLLLRDKERPEDCRMNERCITLLNCFKEKKYHKKYLLDTSDITPDEIVNIIENHDDFIL